MYKEFVYDSRKSCLGISKNIWMWESITKKINLLELNTFLLDLEKKLLLRPPLDDGGTNVGGLTSRYKHYNLLLFDNYQLKKLESFIAENVKNFLTYKNLNHTKIYIQCWYNVLRKNEKIDIHQHRNLEDIHLSFISGHFSTTENNTQTCYASLDKKNSVSVDNEPGKITLFPSYIPHYTTVNNQDKERISIAFDIYPEISFIEPTYMKNGIIKEVMI